MMIKNNYYGADNIDQKIILYVDHRLQFLENNYIASI